MAERIETQAIVLQRFAFGESSQVVHLLTRALGRVVVMARGAWRAKNGYEGPLDLLVRGTVTLSLVHGRELALLTGRKVETAYPRLRSDLARHGAACHVLARILHFEPVGAGAGAFPLVDRALEAIETVDRARLPLLLLAFDARLADLHGLRPDVDQCVRCGSPRKLARFVASAGGVVCVACVEQRDEGAAIDARSAALLRDVATTPLRQLPDPPPATLSRARRLLDLHLEWHADALLAAPRARARPSTRRSSRGLR